MQKKGIHENSVSNRWNWRNRTWIEAQKNAIVEIEKKKNNFFTAFWTSRTSCHDWGGETPTREKSEMEILIQIKSTVNSFTIMRLHQYRATELNKTPP